MVRFDSPREAKIPTSPIVPRHVDLGLDATTVSRYWCAEQAFDTLFANGLSLLFPEGERFFVDSVRHYRARITDPRLLADVTAFITQEAMHGKEHRTYNALQAEQGFALAPRIEGEVRALLKIVRKVLPPIAQLGVTCALEHFTAILAEQLMEDPALHGVMHPRMRSLWLWHAVEESEHKAVAFDVFETVGGRYALRVGVMAGVTMTFILRVSVNQVRLMAGEGKLFSARDWLRGIERLWIRPGLIPKLIPAYLDYYRPSFHPSDRDTRALVSATIEKLFGAAGPLRDHVKLAKAA